MKAHFSIYVSALLLTFLAILVSAQKTTSQEDQEYKKRYLDSADLIALGRVVSIDPAPADLFNADTQTEWKIATVEMLDVYRGYPNNGDSVKIAFSASSVDIELNTEYVFVLRDLSGYKAMLQHEVKQKEYYFASAPERVRPKSNWAKIKELT